MAKARYFEGKRRFDGKGASKVNPFDGKSKGTSEGGRPFDGKLQRALGRQRRRRFEREDCSKAKTL